MKNEFTNVNANRMARRRHLAFIAEAQPYIDAMVKIRSVAIPTYVLQDGILSILDDGVPAESKAHFESAIKNIAERHGVRLYD